MRLQDRSTFPLVNTHSRIFGPHTVPAGMEVVAVVDDDLSLNDIKPIGTHIGGSLAARSPNSTFIDVLTLDGKPVPSAPIPDGFQGQGFGTAAGPGGANLDFELDAPADSVRIRAIAVGGLITNVTEFAAFAS